MNVHIMIFIGFGFLMVFLNFICMKTEQKIKAIFHLTSKENISITTQNNIASAVFFMMLLIEITMMHTGVR